MLNEDDGEAGMEPRDAASQDWNGRNSGGSMRDMQRSGANQAGSRRGAEVPDFGPEHLIGELDSEDPPMIAAETRSIPARTRTNPTASSLNLLPACTPFISVSCFPKTK
jgi:hypothetical protein